MPLPFLVQMLIGFGLMLISYILAPKPKQPKPPEVSDLQDPTAEAGRPVPVIFGSVEVSGLNILWYGDKSITVREVKSGGKK